MTQNQVYKLIFLAGVAAGFRGWSDNDGKKRVLNSEFEHICNSLGLNAGTLF